MRRLLETCFLFTSQDSFDLVPIILGIMVMLANTPGPMLNIRCLKLANNIYYKF